MRFIKLILLIFSSLLLAQEHWCATDSLYETRLKNNPELRREMQGFEKVWQREQFNRVLQKYVSNVLSPVPMSKFRYSYYNVDYNKMYTIPVVFHIIHDKPLDNYDIESKDREIKEFLNYVNNVFSGIDPKTKGPKDGGVYVPVQFALAQRDIDNNPTNGIIHVDASKIKEYVDNGVRSRGNAGITTVELEQLSSWDPNYFLNIYAINKFSGFSGLLAFALTGGKGTVYALEKEIRIGSYTIPHELGHSLSLLHPFHGGSTRKCPSNNDCFMDNDKVCDTEPIRTLFRLTDNPINPCTGKEYDRGPYNIMNYANIADRFSVGQVDRMIFELENNPIKKNLLRNKTYLPPVDNMPEVTSAKCIPSGADNFKKSSYFGGFNVAFGDFLYVFKQHFIREGYKFYVDYTRIDNTFFVAGETYNLHVKNDLGLQAVFIDYNDDGDFDDENESVFTEDIGYVKEVNKKNTIPLYSVKNRTHRMRIVSRWLNRYYPEEDFISLKCAQPDIAQTKDFSITILDPYPDENEIKKAGINTETPETAFEIKSTDKGVLFPKMNNTQMWNIESPAKGMIVYNTSEHCLAVNYGTSEQPLWRCLATRDIN